MIYNTIVQEVVTIDATVTVVLSLVWDKKVAACQVLEKSIHRPDSQGWKSTQF